MATSSEERNAEVMQALDDAGIATSSGIAST